MTEETISVVDSPEQGRFEIHVDGQLGGFTEYIDREAQRIFFHTQIDEAFGGRGLGGRLAKGALDATRAAGLRIVPICPFIAKYLTRHDEYSDIVDKVTPAALAAVPR